MNTELKIKDVVRITSVRYTPSMVISTIDEEKQEAKCVWYDTKARKTKVEILPINILELVPEKPGIDFDEIRRAAYRL